MKEIKHCQSLDELLKDCPKNEVILNSLIKSWNKINSPLYDKIFCSVSGGADSDLILDICYRCDKDNKVIYGWFDTGVELQATKDHLDYLEKKYKIHIRKIKPIKPIPQSCKEYGQPFLSKFVSQNIYYLQMHDFDFKDYSVEEMVKRGVPRVYAQWWNNKGSRILTFQFNIARNKWLKEFLMKYPPNFKISSKCCDYAKKKVNNKYLKENQIQLTITGVRKAEGGIRALNYKSCFLDETTHGYALFMPIFWYKDSDKKEYETAFNIVHSRCYTQYCMLRTGCVGCPFNKNLFEDNEVIKQYEPNMYKAANHIFKDSYEYTKKYKEFCREMNEKQRKEKMLKKKDEE